MSALPERADCATSYGESEPLFSPTRFWIWLMRDLEVRVFFAKFVDRLTPGLGRVFHSRLLQLRLALRDPALFKRDFRLGRNSGRLVTVPMKQAAASGDHHGAENEEGPRLHKRFLTQFLPAGRCQ